MKYYSTKNKNLSISATEAIIKGLPDDNGLFFPKEIPVLNKSFYDNLHQLSTTEIATEVLGPYFKEDIPSIELEKIINKTFSFNLPLIEVKKDVFSLELFHGPTLAFKDIGAKFLAGCLNYIAQDNPKKLKVLVATSGDTGSAVAHGFYGVENVDVVILYPKGKISEFQEMQMTTLGKNIIALSIDGTFDDCQKLVKTAFLDDKLNNSLQLTSANSINIARFLPQSIYYFSAFTHLSNKVQDVVFSVPSGNYGNLTAGVVAQQMGLPIAHFIASSNANDIVPKYLETGLYTPRPSISTISNAMDVGAPSNFERLLELFRNSSMNEMVTGFSFSDIETAENIASVYNECKYILDPHGSVGYLGLEKYLENNEAVGVFLETAHPVKFKEVVEKVLDLTIPIPVHVKPSTNPSLKIEMKNNYSHFTDFLLNSRST